MKKIVRIIKRLMSFVILLCKHLFFEGCQYVQMFVYEYKYSKSPEVRLSKLRVLSHAVDKGLCVSARQDDRGYGKHVQCKKIIEELSKTEVLNDPTLVWAREKNKEYERAKTGNIRLKGESFKVPTDEERQKILRFIRTRRSVRSFKPEGIEPDILSDIVDTARWAPNSCCRQSVFFNISKNQEEITQSMKITLGATCFGEMIPCFICVCGDVRFYPLVDKGLLYIDGALAAENLLLAAHAYGIEGTILNWRPHMPSQEKALRKILQISPYHTIIINIALGYPDFIPPAPARKDLGSVWKLTGAD
ncbi:MAG: nitroreductase family protein [Planctomycetes bacterium]|nr:nitroreductase family protein [Planctomycetota bacterium]